MSDTDGTQVVEPTDTGTGEGGSEAKTAPQLTYEELAAELAKTRREAAGKRVANKELESELDAFRKWKESQMTELEKAQQRATDLEKDRRNDLVELAIAKFGLEDDDADLLAGLTKEEIFASAKRISDRLGKKPEADPKPTNPNLFPGTRGKPVGSGKDDPNEALRALLQGGRR